MLRTRNLVNAYITYLFDALDLKLDLLKYIAGCLLIHSLSKK